MTKALGCPDMTRMEERRRVVWKHPDARQYRLPWRLPKECAGIEYRMHGKICLLRGGIKVLECLPYFLSDVQPLRTFFLDLSHQGLFGRLTGFYPSSREPEVPMCLDGCHPACTVWDNGVDGSPTMIRVAIYLGTEDVLHLSHDG